jgi:hypothetical protein
MRRLLTGVIGPVTLAGLLVLSGTATALAAASPSARHGGGGGGSTTNGHDVSYPQCGTGLPSGAFGIVGVNGGLANDLNACLGPSSSYPSYTQSELYWAVATSSGASTQPKASLYVNTADPGNIYNGTPIGDWPTSSSPSDPYGSCSTTTVTTSSGTYTVGANSAACAWQYGYDKAMQDATWVSQAASAINAAGSPVSVSGAAASYPWWLDVETVNSWQSGTTGQALNVADLQGMVAALQAAGARMVGAYSTASQWNTVTGGTTSSSSGSLYGIPDWIPGAKTLTGAKSNCRLAAFTGGRVVLTQWSGRPDNDYAC